MTSSKNKTGNNNLRGRELWFVSSSKTAHKKITP
jgi:hypothetical protein